MRSTILILSLAGLSLVESLPSFRPELRESSEFTTTNASAIISRAIAAMGGQAAVEQIRGITLSSNAYRSQTLTQNYDLTRSDQSVAEAGSQTLSFNFPSNTALLGRTERSYRYGAYWIWSHPDLSPVINYTLVLRDGTKDGFACFNRGQNSFFAEDHLTEPGGYADTPLADYLVHQARQFALPWLLRELSSAAEDRLLRVHEVIEPATNLSFPAIEHTKLGLSLVFNGGTGLPYKVRSMERHSTLGEVSSDLLLSDWLPVILPGSPNRTVVFPHRLQTIYNHTSVLEDVPLSSVSFNPVFPPDYFAPSPAIDPTLRQPPREDPSYPLSEVHMFFEAGLWGGPLLANLTVRSYTPSPSLLPGVHVVQVVGPSLYADYAQLVVDLPSGALVVDAPPHRSSAVRDWVRHELGKEVRWVLPSHHHHDHAGGVPEFFTNTSFADTTLVVPSVATAFYARAAGSPARVLPYTQAIPFAHAEAGLLVRAHWRDEAAPHARDWAYVAVGPACPPPVSPGEGQGRGGVEAGEEAAVVIFVADVYSPGPGPRGAPARFDAGGVRALLDSAARDGVPRSALVVGAHGGGSEEDAGGPTARSLAEMAEEVGYAYPEGELEGWWAGGC